MKRRAVLKKLKAEAKARGFSYDERELTNHTGIWVGGHRSTLARHTEIDETTAGKFFDQFEVILGKGWWR